MFRKNPNFERELQAEAPYKSGLAAAAEPAAAHARTFAHRIMPSGRGIEVVQDGEKVFVSNFDHGAHLDEFGSVNNQPYAPLRRGARAAGLRLVEE